MATEYTLVRRGRAVSQAEVAQAPIVVAGFGLPDEATGYVFDTDDELLGWAREIGHSEIVERLHEVAEKGREQETRTDLEPLKSWQMKRVERITSDFEDLAQLYGLAVTSPELFAKATIKADPLIGSVFDPYLLFDTEGCGGSWRPISGLVPNFGWLDFNNRASSTVGLGTAILFTRYWFKDRRLYLFNIGNRLGDCLNLADLGWSNIASSAVTF
jgi:hypothetical protein